MINYDEKWWAELPMSTRAVKAMRTVERLNAAQNPKFKNDSLDDFKEIIKTKRLLLLRNVGQNTEDEFCAVLGIKK